MAFATQATREENKRVPVASDDDEDEDEDEEDEEEYDMEDDE